MASIIDVFFKLGDKATRGDPKRQQDFTYYMLWILFLAFGLMFVSNAYHLITNPNAMSAVWTMVGFAVMSLQFFTLKSAYEMKKIRDRPIQKIEPVSEESFEEVLKAFKLKDKKGG